MVSIRVFSGHDALQTEPIVKTPVDSGLWKNRTFLTALLSGYGGAAITRHSGTVKALALQGFFCIIAPQE